MRSLFAFVAVSAVCLVANSAAAQCVGCAGSAAPVFNQGVSNVGYSAPISYASEVNYASQMSYNTNVYAQAGQYNSGMVVAGNSNCGGCQGGVVQAVMNNQVGCSTPMFSNNNCGQINTGCVSQGRGRMLRGCGQTFASNCGQVTSGCQQTFTSNCGQVMGGCQQVVSAGYNSGCGNTMSGCGSYDMQGVVNAGCGGMQTVGVGCGDCNGSVMMGQPIMGYVEGSQPVVEGQVQGQNAEIVTPPAAADESTPPVPSPGPETTEGEKSSGDET